MRKEIKWLAPTIVIAMSVLMAVSISEGWIKPIHNTVTVTCPFSLCTGASMVISTSDSASWREGFSVGTTPVTFTFTGLKNGSNAVDLANPTVRCSSVITGDSTKIRMTAGSSVTGGPISPNTFTVPNGITATITISC